MIAKVPACVGVGCLDSLVLIARRVQEGSDLFQSELLLSDLLWVIFGQLIDVLRLLCL